jgi:hypothetical protein
MFSQPLKQQNTFPDIPRNEPFLNQDGTVNHYWMLYFDNLNMALQRTFSPEGFVMPDQSQSDIDTYLIDDEVFIANIIYDNTNNVFNGNILNTASNPPDGTQYWIPFAMITTSTTNPNGHVPGYVTELCLDTVGKVLYVCTTAGDAASAVWTAT